MQPINKFIQIASSYLTSGFKTQLYHFRKVQSNDKYGIRLTVDMKNQVL